MSKEALSIPVPERLAHYNVYSEQTNIGLSEEVVEHVSALDERRRSFGTFGDYLDDCNYAGTTQYQARDKGSVISIADFRPSGDFDEKRVRVYHLPMANGLDPNMLYQAAAVFETEPDTRLIAVGNPGAYLTKSGRYNTGVLIDPSDRKALAGGDLYPTIYPVSEFLNKEGIERVDHVGYSLGASKVVASAITAEKYGHEVVKAIAIDPADVVTRGLLKMGVTFMGTNKHLGAYVDANADPNFTAARKLSAGPLSYPVGLARLTNLAYARGLARDGFEARAQAAMDAQSDMKLAVIWGQESELALHGVMEQAFARLRATNPGRVADLRVGKGHHAMVNDIALQTALVLQASRNLDSISAS